MLDSFQALSQVLPHIAVIAAVCGFVGWSLRGRSQQPVQGKPSKPQPSPAKGTDRVKNLEAALEKSRATHKALKAEMDSLKETSVGKPVLEATTAELEASHKLLEAETKRVSALEVELKKAQETNKSLNARSNGADKAQKDRHFAIENELSKTRQQLADLQERPDDSAELHVEIARLKESVAVSTRFAGEMRKREATAVEALEKAQAQLAAATDPSRPAPSSKKIGPVVESGRIAAAKAEVLRLVEMNKQKAAETPEVTEAASPAVDEAPEAAPAAETAANSEAPEAPEAASLAVEEVPEEAPAAESAAEPEAPKAFNPFEAIRAIGTVGTTEAEKPQAAEETASVITELAEDTLAEDTLADDSTFLADDLVLPAEEPVSDEAPATVAAEPEPAEKEEAAASKATTRVQDKKVKRVVRPDQRSIVWTWLVVGREVGDAPSMWRRSGGRGPGSGG